MKQANKCGPHRRNRQGKVRVKEAGWDNGPVVEL